jgi:hypothetical protein
MKVQLTHESVLKLRPTPKFVSSLGEGAEHSTLPHLDQVLDMAHPRQRAWMYMGRFSPPKTKRAKSHGWCFQQTPQLGEQVLLSWSRSGQCLTASTKQLFKTLQMAVVWFSQW